MPLENSPGPERAADAVRTLDTPLGPTILLDRPHRRNALTLDMWQALGERVLELAARTTGPVYLMGAGGYFSSGADLGALTWARSSEEAAQEFVEGVVTCLLRLHLADREIVAVVEGGAAGGGVEIMAACDRRVAVGAPRLVFPFGQHGMELDGLTRWRLTGLVGEQEAQRLTEGLHAVPTEEALGLGLFDQRHETLEALAAAESGRAGEPLQRAAENSYLQPGEGLEEAVARASVPMLRAFPPHWDGGGPASD